jgi:transposase
LAPEGRWHLIENASAALLDAVRRSMRRIRTALGAATIDPGVLTSVERRQHEGFLRRAAIDAAIRRMVEAGAPINEIVRRTGHSRKLIRAIARGVRTEMFRTRMTTLDAFLPRLDAEWAAGCRNGAEFWRRSRAAGFSGALRLVSEWATRRRRSDSMPGALTRQAALVGGRVVQATLRLAMGPQMRSYSAQYTHRLVV